MEKTDETEICKPWLGSTIAHPDTGEPAYPKTPTA